MEEHGSEDGVLEFFKIVFEPVSQGVRLPTLFMKSHSHSFIHKSMVTLSVPSGDSWSVQLRENDTGFWLGRGWEEFAAHYGIEARHFLYFKYQRNARFRVIIMDATASEIDYPLKASNFEAKVKADNFEDEADDGKGILGFDSNPGRIVGTVKEGEKAVFESYQKAMEFKSEKPFILSFMQPSYLTGGSYILSMNSGTVRDFLRKECNNGQCIVKAGVGGSDEVWTMHWNLYRRGRKITSLKGWKKFAVDNKLRVADVCVFELVDKAALHFNVTIFRNT